MIILNYILTRNTHVFRERVSIHDFLRASSSNYWTVSLILSCNALCWCQTTEQKISNSQHSLRLFIPSVLFWPAVHPAYPLFPLGYASF